MNRTFNICTHVWTTWMCGHWTCKDSKHMERYTAVCVCVCLCVCVCVCVCTYNNVSCKIRSYIAVHQWDVSGVLLHVVRIPFAYLHVHVHVMCGLCVTVVLCHLLLTHNIYCHTLFTALWACEEEFNDWWLASVSHYHLWLTCDMIQWCFVNTIW